MADLAAGSTIKELLAVLSEAFEGTQGGSYFIDGGPGSGLLANLEALSASSASRPIGGSTVGAHAHHLSFSLGASTAWIRGDRGARDWTQSWSVTTVTDQEWTKLQVDLREGYGELRRAIEFHAADSPDSMGGAIGVIAHVAYHLGAIRQKLLLLG